MALYGNVPKTDSDYQDYLKLKKQFIAHEKNNHAIDTRLHQSMYLWAKSYLPNFVLKTLGDRMEMANAVSARVAFLDHKLVELAN